jgi:hypothetical protein
MALAIFMVGLAYVFRNSGKMPAAEEAVGV